MESLWKKTSVLPQFPTLQENINTDVLIIGGGLAGILTAYFLKERGISYTLVEKGRICDGVTANTTAKITAQHGLCYHKILKSNGKNVAEMYLNANLEAVNKYYELCKDINCDFEKKDNYVYSVDNQRILDKEIEALWKIGYEPDFCEPRNLPFKTAGSVIFHNQAQFHPLKFVAEISKNLNIYENTHIEKIDKSSALTDKFKINFKNAVITTHFPFINNHGFYYLKLYQERSYVIALENAPDVKGMFVDENNGGFSFRNHENLLLLGGGSHKTGKCGGKFSELRDFKRIYYPRAKEVCSFATQDCMSLDGIPYIGKYSSVANNFYVASGFNKWGISSSMVSAMLISDMLCEKENPFSQAFNPSRSILKPQLFINGFEAVKNLLTPTTKRCPHLGCALKWNKEEHTWDCPCHGSRFSEDGKLLDNPANGNL